MPVYVSNHCQIIVNYKLFKEVQSQPAKAASADTRSTGGRGSLNTLPGTERAPLIHWMAERSREKPGFFYPHSSHFCNNSLGSNTNFNFKNFYMCFTHIKKQACAHICIHVYVTEKIRPPPPNIEHLPTPLYTHKSQHEHYNIKKIIMRINSKMLDLLVEMKENYHVNGSRTCTMSGH